MVYKLIGIKQIIPAEGWYALFEQKGGGHCRERLACWAFVQREGPSREACDRVEGMIAEEYGIDHCESSDNFASYCHESALDQYPEAEDQTGAAPPGHSQAVGDAALRG